MFEKPREEGGPPVGEPLGMSERRCVCVPRCHAMPRSAFQRLMRWQMYNAWGGSPESLITDSTLGLSTHTYIHTPLNDPAMIIWLVDIPWPLLTYLPSFPLVPCLSAPSNPYACSESSEHVRWKFSRRIYTVDSLISRYFQAGQGDS